MKWSAVEDRHLIVAVSDNPSISLEDLRRIGRLDCNRTVYAQRNRYARLVSCGKATAIIKKDTRETKMDKKFTRSERIVIAVANILRIDPVWAYAQIYQITDVNAVARQALNNENVVLCNTKELYAAILLVRKFDAQASRRLSSP